MRDHRETFEKVRKRPGMYVYPPTFDAVVAFVNGYNEACEGGTLCGNGRMGLSGCRRKLAIQHCKP